MLMPKFFTYCIKYPFYHLQSSFSYHASIFMNAGPSLPSQLFIIGIFVSLSS